MLTTPKPGDQVQYSLSYRRMLCRAGGSESDSLKALYRMVLQDHRTGTVIRVTADVVDVRWEGCTPCRYALAALDLA